MNIKSAAAALGTAVMLSISADAATIEQIQYIDFPTPIIDLTLDGVFNQYNGPGTLTAAKLVWNVGSTGIVTATGCQTSQACEPGTYSLRISGSGAFTGVSQIDVDGLIGIDQVITNDTDEIQTGSFNRSISNIFNFSNLADFVGIDVVPGMIDFVAAYDGFFDSGSVFGGFGGLVALVYTVCDQPGCGQQIPEPAGLAGLGLGLTALGLVRRRRAA